MGIKELVTALGKLRAFDVSPLFETNMVNYPTHTSMGIIHDARNFELHGYYAQTIVLSEHTGSHVDAPAHAKEDMQDASIDKYPVNYLLGVYKKYDLTSFDFEPGDLVPLDAIKKVEQGAGFEAEADDIILLQFGWDKYLCHQSTNPHERNWWATNVPGLSEETCEYFASKRIRAIGSDTSGCDTAEVDGEIKAEFGHKKFFLPNHILIIEGLLNLQPAPKTGIFIGLPLKIKNGSGSPIRPLLLG